MTRISVSTGLNQFKNCPKCFWLHYNKGVKRPAGIFPSLPNGMDLVIKNYFDSFRKVKKIPPIVSKQIKGKLVEFNLIEKWRDWRIGLEYKINKETTLIGALDDCSVHKNKYIPIDYKTKGSPPGEGYGEKYYQLQLDIYSLLLSVNEYPVGDHAFLVYYSPKTVNGCVVDFEVNVLKVSIDINRAEKILNNAINVLAENKAPESDKSCIYCNFVKQRGND